MKKAVDFSGKKWYYNPRAADTAAARLRKREIPRKKLKKVVDKSETA